VLFTPLLVFVAGLDLLATQHRKQLVHQHGAPTCADAGCLSRPCAGYFYRPSTGELIVSAANRVNVKGWNSGMTANTATNNILSK
jgi:hypothetical protein